MTLLALIRNSQNTFYVLKVKPPFVFRMRFPVSEEVIPPKGESSQHRNVGHRPSDHPAVPPNALTVKQ